jgi:translocation and assembly module TamA
VLVTLADRPRLTVEAELSYASSEGFGVDGQLVRANLLGRADTWRITARAAQIEQRLDTEVRLPHWRRSRQTLAIGAGAFRDDTDAFRQTGVRLRADVTRRWGLTSFVTLGVASDYSTTREPSFLNPVQGIARDFTAVSLVLAGLWDNANDPLDPRSGWKADARLEPTWLTGDASLGFVRAVGQASSYHAFGSDERTVLATRLRVASLIGGSIPEIPSGRRLYAGGGGSVRGYEFQGIGPRYTDPDRTPVGGLSLVEASLEVRHDLEGFGGRFGLVGFLDAGTLGLDPTPTLDGLRGGVGFGVRYDLGFAPLRFDVAFPLDDRLGGDQFQLYLGVGQSF